MKPDSPAGCAGLLVSLLLAAPKAIWAGFVLSKLWLWFVALPFHVKPIDIPVAIGLYMTVHFCTAIYEDDRHDPTWRDLSRRCLVATLFPAFTLLAAWIVTWFLP